jgi:hypothetical protein
VLVANPIPSTVSSGKEIDIVVTRNDTVYVLLSWHEKPRPSDGMNIAKIYDAGGIWTHQWIISPDIDGTKINSPKLERDDFDDFYLYGTYLEITAGSDTAFILRSTDRGDNWDTLATGSATVYQDADITVTDSTLHALWTFLGGGGSQQYLQYAHWRNRGDVGLSMTNLFINDTASYTEMKYPRIGATTESADSEQLVYAFFSQEEALSGDHNLLYVYSENGGNDWTATPDTLAKGSIMAIYSDIRGYQAAPNNPYMNITYSLTAFDIPPTYANFWGWSLNSDPTNWQGINIAGTGETTSIPELVYSPGASATGIVYIVYNDSYGNLWFDAPWFSGITENKGKKKDKIRSQIVLTGSSVELSSTGSIVYDVTGREIIKLNTDSWDLKDGKGKEVKGGIYFIVNKEKGNRIKLSIIK